jgi:hypothetical protein
MTKTPQWQVVSGEPLLCCLRVSGTCRRSSCVARFPPPASRLPQLQFAISFVRTHGGQDYENDFPGFLNVGESGLVSDLLTCEWPAVCIIVGPPAQLATLRAAAGYQSTSHGCSTLPSCSQPSA